MCARLQPNFWTRFIEIDSLREFESCMRFIAECKEGGICMKMTNTFNIWSIELYNESTQNRDVPNISPKKSKSVNESVVSTWTLTPSIHSYFFFDLFLLFTFYLSLLLRQKNKTKPNLTIIIEAGDPLLIRLVGGMVVGRGLGVLSNSYL